MDYQLQHILSSKQKISITTNLELEKVSYSTYDSSLQLGLKTFTGWFYHVKKITDRHLSKKIDENLLLETNIFLSPSIMNNLRIVYGMTNLLSDLGGVMSIMISVCGIVFRPFSKFMYYTNAIKRLFLARTRDKHLFKPAKSGNMQSMAE